MHPRLFQFGHLVLPTYGVLIALGLILSLLVCLRTARLLLLDTGKIWNLALLVVVVAILGAKFLLAAARWSRYGAHALTISLSGTHRPLFGGIALAIAAGWLYAWRVHLPIRRTADALAPALALGSSVASIACLEAGCGYGTLTHLPWAIVFTSPYAAAPDVPLGAPLHPTQIYASLAEFVLFVLLLRLLHRPHYDGEVMGAWLFLGGLSNFFLAFLRGDRYGELFGGLLTVAQLIAVAMVLGGGWLWLRRPAALEAPHAG